MPNENNKDFIKKYIPLADFVADILGPSSEVVLNDVTDLDHAVVYIKNPTITNRKIGDPASNFVLKIMKEGIDDNTNYIANYFGKSKSHPHLRSSTYFIRKNNKVIGMLCINIDQGPLENLAKQLEIFRNLFEVKTNPISEYESSATNSSSTKEISENFNNSVNSLAEAAVKQKERELGITANYFQQEQKIDLIKGLYEEGYFLLKDSIRVIAEYLDSSVPTIYRYLNKVKKSNTSK
ncbi:PAS domain-containing protein [Limosilactobacillus sp. STM2_1]|uniref:PAS domain-containing protein n=1 Tax=Limosilactobacillus rudii TaxID=2759755 RepID=A0A7W3UIS7_9LACO|nr:PAS domain-containing protein [Limosilactobacillus rudii]MBB1080140.1 PAS domain-containing protein [Limosilactobacillus rudii]MBB1096372.1 PAS domain-containing protein [Limosilactobacillus rudii]MCD7133627.1 PAS domain-containing protein [Limosilactobacillus rudii]